MELFCSLYALVCSRRTMATLYGVQRTGQYVVSIVSGSSYSSPWTRRSGTQEIADAQAKAAASSALASSSSSTYSSVVRSTIPAIGDTHAYVVF